MPSVEDASTVLGILLISAGHERAHYALMLAVGAAAVGRRVVVFATNEGCRALAADWRGMADAGRDAGVMAAGVAGMDELREAVDALGVTLMACDAGLRMAGMAASALLPGVTVAGIPTFLSATRGGTVVTL